MIRRSRLFRIIEIVAMLAANMAVGVGVLFLFGDGVINATSASIMFLYFFVTFMYLKRSNSFEIAILYMTILTLPTSFISIAGSDYAKLPVSWFLVCILSLFIISLGKLEKNIRFYIPSIVFLLFFAISIFIFGASVDALKQMINILIFSLALPIGKYFLSKKPQEERLTILHNSMKLYILVAISFALTIIVQALFIQSTGQAVGEYDAFGGGRTSFAALFSDYSFASLFLASAIVPLFYLLFKKGSIFKKVFFVSIIILLMYALFLTTARTGLVALIVTIFVLLIYLFLKNGLRTQFAVLVTTLLAILISGLLLSLMAESRGGQGVTEGSNRLEDYGVALNLFSENALLGTGFGLDRYVDLSSGVPIPHNFFIQYLTQGGVIGLAVLLACVFASYAGRRRDRNVVVICMLILLFVGSMFIPDILHSRVIIVLTLLYVMSEGLWKYEAGAKRKIVQK